MFQKNHTKRKKHPYIEIIDTDAEFAEYRLLCKCESTKYQHYSDWETHIKSCLSKIFIA